MIWEPNSLDPGPAFKAGYCKIHDIRWAISLIYYGDPRKEDEWRVKVNTCPECRKDARFRDQRFDEEEPLSGPLYGWRLFKMEHWLLMLTSLFRSHLWPPNEIIEAKCSNNSRQPKPHVGIPYHDCGFHAFYRQDETITYAINYRALENGDPRRVVIGVVKAFGNIVLHDQGFRSSQMKVVSVSPFTGDTETAVDLAQAGYRVAKDLDELATFAKYTADYYGLPGERP